MISSIEKESLEKGITRDTVVSWLRELFQDQRYEAIVEAIELHKEDRGRRKLFLQKSVLKIIRIEMIGQGFADLKEKESWEYYFKSSNNKYEKTWEDSILESLQSGSTGAFSRGIQAIKQSIIDFNKTR